jgi:hypothetical protein
MSDALSSKKSEKVGCLSEAKAIANMKPNAKLQRSDA